MTWRLPLTVCALALAGGFTHAALSTSVPAACHTVDVGDHLPISWEEVQRLHAADRAERLYSPACFARSDAQR